MPWVKTLTLAALLLYLPLGASASAGGGDDAHWVRDASSNCAIFDADYQPGDTITWSGDCSGGLGEGVGTVAFLKNGETFESFTGSFSKGVVQDGIVTVTWGQGWRYSGGMVKGQFEGHGALIKADGTKLEGEFADGKLVEPPDAPAPVHTAAADEAAAAPPPAAVTPPPAADPTADADTDPMPIELGGLSGKRLVAVDGTVLALNAAQGGIAREITSAAGVKENANFSFINEKLGTVATNGGWGQANAAGLFRLTVYGVDVRYSDGRNETLSLAPDGGLTIRVEALGKAPSCRSFYPEGHAFSDAEKKAALADYASRLGIAATVQAAACPNAAVAASARGGKPRPEQRRADAKSALHIAAEGGRIAGLQPVAVKQSQVHLIDLDPALAAPQAAMPSAPGDPSHCLKVDSDGLHWGMRNACDYDIQFSYCLAKGGNSLTGCDGGGVAGSVAAKGFGALLADTSLKESDGEHDFRWLACKGGAGEVVAHLEHSDPPSGRCERAAEIASAKGTGK